MLSITRYIDMINDFFVPELEDVDVADLWLVRPYTTCHTANDTTNLLKEIFGEGIIQQRGPPRLCALTLSSQSRLYIFLKYSSSLQRIVVHFF